MGVLTMATAFVGHPFWSVETEQFAGQLNNFMKNVAITGAFLLLALQGQDRKSIQQS
ncbi:Inner membrane protein YphA [compost metagenome]